MQELTGIVDGAPRKFESGFVIFTLRDGHKTYTVTGDDSDIHEADVVQCEGVFVEYKGVTQFKAKMIVPQIPSTSEGIIDFLASGRIKGIKTQYALRLVKAFGKDVLSVIENEPHRLKEVSGFGPVRIKTLTDGLKEQIGFRSILVFLHNFGLKKHLINKIYKKYGVNAVERIKSNPYSLCQEIEGIGFAIADRIGRKAGMKADDPHRIMAGITHSLSGLVNSTGSTGVRRTELSKTTFNLFTKSGEMVETDKIIEGIDILVESPFAKVREIAGEEAIFPTYLWDAEVGIASHLKRLQDGFKHRRGKQVMKHIVAAQHTLGIDEMDGAQLEAVKMSLLNAVSVITGGPGTGKTTIVRVILEVLKTEYGIQTDDILLCAPTGKAAARLAESSGLEASTLHRALSYAPENDGFLHNEEQPLEAKVILVDEASMVDTQLTHWFIQAVRTGAQVIIVGDVDQLASVGPGRVLKDLIDSGVIPITRLTEIYRQAKGSRIIVNSHAVNRGEIPELNNSDDNNDFWFINSKKDSDIANKIIALIDRLSNHYGYDKVEDIQVLTPMRRGSVGVAELNRRLQKLLNPNLGSGIKLTQEGADVEFCQGDKIIHIKNNYSMDVMNGMVGRIRSVDVKSKKLVVLYDQRLVEYAWADLEQIRLAYAMTIHKSQGSEYPCVIIPFTTSHQVMLSRSLYYTGITRTKKNFVGVGDRRALEMASRIISSESRITGLREHLQSVFG